MSKMMGEKVEKEVVGQVVAKAAEVGDVANESLQVVGTKKIALRNAKMAGVKNTQHNCLNI